MDKEIFDIEYKISGEGLSVLDGCANKAFIQEQKEMIRAAFSTVTLSLEYDSAWNTVRIVAVNNQNLCGCP